MYPYIATAHCGGPPAPRDGRLSVASLLCGSIDCAGILKLRNADIELRKGETDIGRKNTRVRLVFRVHIPEASGRIVSLQTASNPIECCKCGSGRGGSVPSAGDTTFHAGPCRPGRVPCKIVQGPQGRTAVQVDQRGQRPSTFQGFSLLYLWRVSVKNNMAEKQPAAWLRRFEVSACWAGLKKGRCSWSQLAVLSVLCRWSSSLLSME